MTRVIAAVIGGLLLGGCALPVPVQVVSWALDGFSLLTTKKSLTDHGISALAQQDCALWRGVTEGSVCREDDPMAILAEKGDVAGGDEATDTGSSLTSSLQNVFPSNRGETQPDDIQSSWVMTSENAVDTAPANEPASEAVETAQAETGRFIF